MPQKADTRKNYLKKIVTENLEVIGWSIFVLITISIYTYSSHIGLWLASGGFKKSIEQAAPSAQDFLTLTLSVIVEATPFLILGIVASALIRRFLPPDRLVKILPGRPFLRRLTLSITGMALPVCECGNVPVARSLMAHGLKPSDVISFLFAAPILNPITIIATMTAFSMEPRMVWWRAIFALIIVQITAFIVSFMKDDNIINPEFKDYCAHNKDRSNLKSLFSDSRNEFWQLFTMLTIGALIAAGTQMFVPRSIINVIGGDIFMSVIAMVGLGFVISICSSIDAFFALAYVRTFTTGSILAFLLAGPMVDIKLIMLMKTTFKLRFIFTVMTIIFALSILAGVGVNLYAR